MKELRTAFERRCEKVAEETGVGVDFFGAKGDKYKSDVYEDDGNLHIFIRNEWACFNVGQGQTLEGKEQNENTRKVLTALGLEKHITNRSLVEEEEEEDDCCHHCGR